MLKRSGLKLAQLRSLVRRQTAAWARSGIELGTVVIDHVGLIHPDQTTRDRYADQTIVSNTLKELAEELGCAIIALNQMNRENERREEKRPQTHDLRDSGSWEQDADFIIGCYREAYYAQRQPEPKVTKAGKAGEDQQLAWSEWDRARRSQTIEAIVLKAREGEIGTVKLWGDVARNAIRSAAPEGDLL
jgi:replicative DNA helicase